MVMIVIIVIIGTIISIISESEKQELILNREMFLKMVQKDFSQMLV